MDTLIPLADGAEEMESVIITDVLRRAGWQVVLAGFAEEPVVASRGVRLLPDALWSDVRQRDYDMLIIPGGAGGVERLCAEASVLETVRAYDKQERWLAAICAGPLVLETAGILKGRRVTSHPAVADRIKTASLEEAAVVRDGRLLTSRGPGTAILFALALVACESVEIADSLADAMVCDPEIRETRNRLFESS